MQKLRALVTSATALALITTTLVTGGAASAVDDVASPTTPTPIVTPISEAVAPPNSYPSQTPLPVAAVDDTDASIARGAVPYHDIAVTVNGLMTQSDRVSAQAVGTSVQGREIQLVTVTAPESEAQTQQQASWRDAIKNNAVAASGDQELLDDYKVPIWFNGNIHGNEWEGADVILDYIEKLATSTDPEVVELLEHFRFYFTITNNPDGRVAGTRANGDGFDANRDMITGATPESRVIRDLAAVIQPTFYLDLHGYTDVLQVEPCGPPHGENYEYDLFLPHAYSAALAIEEAVVGANIPGNTYQAADGGATTENTGKIMIPYRDIRSGWDDWPPIFTPQYLAYQGAVTNTVELPLGRTGDAATDQSNTLVNTQVGAVVMDSSVGYFADNSAALLQNQIEIFRRGDAGEPKRETPADVDPSTIPEPNEWAEIWDETDVYTTTYPRAYVIPKGQRSETDAARLVDQLIANGVEVQRATADFTAGGTSYAAGSYVVDMHQPLRSMANVLLADGTDISDRVPDMYDISSWSLALLWGADVDAVGDTSEPQLGIPTEPITESGLVGVVPEGGSYLELVPSGVAEYQAINMLLDRGIAVSQFDDGTVIVAADSVGRAAALEVADAVDVTFTASDGVRLLTESSTGLQPLKVAYIGDQDDRLSLQKLGFSDIVGVTASGLDDGSVSLAEADVLWVGDQLRGQLSEAARQQFIDFVAAGKGVSGAGEAIATFANDYGLTSVTATTGTRGSNGIVRVDYPEQSLLTQTAQETAFVYPATWYTELGENATVEQSYAEDLFVSGHWAGDRSGAIGQASAVSAIGESGTRLVMLGTSVNFRNHPVGSFSWMARALHWTAQGGTPVSIALAEEHLKDVTRGTVDVVPDEVVVGTDFAVMVGGEGIEGQQVLPTLFSDPVALAQTTVSGGGISLTLPVGTPLGEHKLAVQGADGLLIGWDSFTAVQPADTEPEPPEESGADGAGGGADDGGVVEAGAGGEQDDLSSTGGDGLLLAGGIGIAALLIGAGALLMARRRREATRPAE